MFKELFESEKISKALLAEINNVIDEVYAEAKAQGLSPVVSVFDYFLDIVKDEEIRKEWKGLRPITKRKAIEKILRTF